jgi:hypothetical protein
MTCSGYMPSAWCVLRSCWSATRPPPRTGPGAAYETGVITDGRTRHWSVPAGVIAGDLARLSVQRWGHARGHHPEHERGGAEDTAWVLPTRSAPGSLTARARKVYDHTHVGGAGHAMTILYSARLGPELTHRLPDQRGDPNEDDTAAARDPPRAVCDARLVIWIR